VVRVVQLHHCRLCIAMMQTNSMDEKTAIKSVGLGVWTRHPRTQTDVRTQFDVRDVGSHTIATLATGFEGIPGVAVCRHASTAMSVIKFMSGDAVGTCIVVVQHNANACP
jgi:hypothetical protein